VAVLEDALRVERPNLERSGLYARLGALRAATGDLDGARAATSLAGSRLGVGSADPSMLVLLATVEAELALAEGRPTEAAGIASRAVEGPGTLVASAETWRLLRVAAAASVASSRRVGGSPPDRLIEAARKQEAREPGSPWVHILAAELADGDAERWRRAAAAAAEDTVPVLVRLQVLFRTGETALAAGSRAEAADLLGEVVRSSTRLGARGVLDAARDLVSRARLKVEDADVVATDRSGPDGLTPRELEVLHLVAAGRSNASIAASLVISIKTVSVHVSHILDKLGVASRGEAAATARARGLVGPEQPAHRQ
jgi:DNA-binding NarL/FixJ family response regulator